MSLRSTASALALLGLLAACASRPEPAPVVYRGSDPGARPPAVAQPAPSVAQPAPGALTPDARGVVAYGGYSAVVARPGDSVAAMARRVGLSPSALAAYNGLPAEHAPRPGDELILPPDAGAYQTAALPEQPDEGPLAPQAQPGEAASAAEQPAPQGAVRFDLDRIEAEVAAPDTSGTGASESAALAPQAMPDPVAQTPRTRDTEQRPLAPEAVVQPREAAFLAPVDGRIVRPFGGSAGSRNDGVDFAAPVGAPVRAAADGEVALVSQSLGGLGTIVLIRHADQLLTVYGRVDGVTVARGDAVRQGDVIGAVAPRAEGAEPSLHFEVRRGAESVDPGDFLS